MVKNKKKKPAKRKISPRKRKVTKGAEGTEGVEGTEVAKGTEVNENTTAPSDTSETSSRSINRKKADVATKSTLKRGLFSLQLGRGKKKDAAPKEKSGIGKFFASINNIGMGKQRVAMIQSLAMMMNAGLPLTKALSTLVREIRSKAVKKIVLSIAAAVDSGTPLWRAMEQQYLFTPYELALVRIGEEAGSLAKNMEYLAEQQEKDRALRSKVRMAMIYPTIVMVLMFVIVMGLGMFVLPNLIQVLLSLNADLPFATRAVIYFTNMFTEYGAIFIPGIIVGFIVLTLLSKFTRFCAVTQWISFHIPGIGTLGRTATIARFGVILGGLLRAGVPLVESLRSLEDVTHIVAYKKFYGKLTDHINQGDSFGSSFESIKNSEKILPISVQQLVITGEQSGTLSETLLMIAEIYEKKAEETAERLPVILEPMLLLFIGGLVGSIAFAIITPIYSVVGNVGR